MRVGPHHAHVTFLHPDVVESATSPHLAVRDPPVLGQSLHKTVRCPSIVLDPGLMQGVTEYGPFLRQKVASEFDGFFL